MSAFKRRLSVCWPGISATGAIRSCQHTILSQQRSLVGGAWYVEMKVGVFGLKQQLKTAKVRDVKAAEECL
jgi:hypothetical protein